MTNDTGVFSPTAAAPVSRAEPLDLVRMPGAKKVDQGSPSSELSASAQAAGQRPERAALEQTVQDLNSLVQNLQREVRFSLDDNSGEVVVKIVDRQTDDVIRQIPSEDVLQLREKLQQATGAVESTHFGAHLHPGRRPRRCLSNRGGNQKK